MQFHNLLFLPRTHYLEFCRVFFFLFAVKDVVEHCGEPSVVGFDIGGAVESDGRGLGETYGADFGVGEDDGRDEVVREF